MSQQTKGKNFFLNTEVESSCNKGSQFLFNIFEGLFLQHKKQQKDLAEYLGCDKSYVSRICHGKEIPILRIRLMIAEFFKIDSSYIWRVKDIDLIREILKHQGGKK